MTNIIIVSLAGLAAGGALTWLFLRSRVAGTESRLSELRETLEKTVAERDRIRDEREQLKSDFDRLDAKREQELKHWEEKEQTLHERFEALSQAALEKNNERFLRVAKTEVEKLLKDVEQTQQKRKHQMEKLVDPLSKSLQEVTKHIKDVEKQRVEAYSGLKQQVKGLTEAQVTIQKETANLVNALRRPSVRGRWGEIQLRRVVEMAGMVDHCDFEEQHSVDSDEGRLRPDMIVRLPNEKIIVVDAKASLAAYLEGVESDSEDDRERHMKRHADQVRAHIRKLGTKSYQDQFSTTPDLVVLFLPGESFFYAALQEDPHLIEFGAERNIVIATPTTLIALLRAVAYGWRQEQITENARRISELGQDLYDRLCTFVEHVGRMGRNLNTAVGSYNDAVGSLERRVLVSARRFQDLGASSSKQLKEVDPIDESTRNLEAEEAGSNAGAGGQLGEGVESDAANGTGRQLGFGERKETGGADR